MNIIGDIAGNYKTLMALLKKMPDEMPISVGDMIDRGPRSKEVLEFFMKNGKAVIGNHEHMMLFYFFIAKQPTYDTKSVWLWNGGGKTLESFDSVIPADIMQWVRELPVTYEEDGLLISHAPRPSGISYEDWIDIDNPRRLDDSAIWNRYDYTRTEGKFHVFGHNYDSGQIFSDEKGPFGAGIDATMHRQVMGMHWPSMQIYTQEFID